ncbi:MAG: phosphoglucosamine mutase [Methanomicrobiales archaeon HGW-Methanomicrobiales-3]|jgi:phosphomannomutase/phosphoglucomutase|nr:MAG: phosphoglucosamine mutase [Methanomicrobiales archaeon HGW-Methanomicrobiales-3]
MTSQKKIEKKLFGTNGVRGVVGKDLTPDLVLSIAEAFGTMRKGRIGIGRDTRTSGETLVHAAKAGLLATGCEVVDCGILPTPALQYLVREQFDGGVMITASHNPPEYNGVKIIEPDGTEMGDAETVKLEQIIFSRTFTPVPWDRAGKESYSPNLLEHYINAIVDSFPPDTGAGMTVAVDPGSGPACLTTARILTDMGCHVLTVNGVIDGTFPGRMPEPTVEGLRNLADLVVSSGAAFGVAHDGDADRAVFIDEMGRYVEENQEFALVARHICHENPGTIVTPVSTGQVVERVAQLEGSDVVYTPVGSIYVARAMRSLIDQGRKIIFGGEGNGGLIFPAHQFCRDGGMTAATMVAIQKESGKTLSENVNLLPQRKIIKDKLTTTRGLRIIEALKNEYSQEKTDQTDGLKIFRGDSWGLVRASGTEPIIRIIIDADSDANANTLHQDLRSSVQKNNET